MLCASVRPPPFEREADAEIDARRDQEKHGEPPVPPAVEHEA